MKREGDKFEYYGLCGKIHEFTLADVSSVETVKGCCGTAVRVRFTDEAYEKIRKEDGCCGSKKHDLTCLSTKELEKMVADFGLSGAAA